jgi:multicomponent Na+:H+ antiporter subunit B
MESLIVAVLLTMMAAATVVIAVQRNLFAVVILSGIYSFLMATVLVALDAVDVAMTEAAVGAGISTVLLLSALYLSKGEEMKPLHKPVLPLIVAIATGGALVYGTLDLPAFSDPRAPIHVHVAPRYIQQAYNETGVENIVTAVLASYRGYDTLGETTVVFTAGVGVIALLRRRARPKEKPPA